jgi:hypothetical protein
VAQSENHDPEKQFARLKAAATTANSIRVRQYAVRNVALKVAGQAGTACCAPTKAKNKRRWLTALAPAFWCKGIAAVAAVKMLQNRPPKRRRPLRRLTSNQIP